MEQGAAGEGGIQSRRCALVTGASSGIGAAFARELHARGEHLVLVARRRERLEALAGELGGAAVLAADLSQPNAVEQLARNVEALGLEIDLLVNCAGFGHTGAFAVQPTGMLQEMIAVNVTAVVEMTRAFLPGMRARDRGRIVNVASNAAFQPVPYLTVYAATKAFVLSFTEGLAEELRGTGIRVQALCPGTTATEFFDVAGTHAGLLVERVPKMSTCDVVRASLRGLDAGRLRVVPGLHNRILGFLVTRLAPRGFVRRVAARLYRPRS